MYDYFFPNDIASSIIGYLEHVFNDLFILIPFFNLFITIV